MKSGIESGPGIPGPARPNIDDVDARSGAFIVSAFSKAENPYAPLERLKQYANEPSGIFYVSKWLGEVIAQMQKSMRLLEDADRAAEYLRVTPYELNGRKTFYEAAKSVSLEDIPPELKRHGETTIAILKDAGVDMKQFRRGIKGQSSESFTEFVQPLYSTLLDAHRVFLENASSFLNEFVQEIDGPLEDAAKSLKEGYSQVLWSAYVIENANTGLEESKQTDARLLSLMSEKNALESEVNSLEIGANAGIGEFWDMQFAENGLNYTYFRISPVISGMAALVKAGKNLDDIKEFYAGSRKYFGAGSSGIYGAIYHPMLELRRAGTKREIRNEKDLAAIYDLVLQASDSPPGNSGDIAAKKAEISSVQAKIAKRTGEIDQKIRDNANELNKRCGFLELLEKHMDDIEKSRDVIKNFRSYLPELDGRIHELA